MKYRLVVKGLLTVMLALFLFHAHAQQTSVCAGDCEWEHMMQRLMQEPSAVSEYDVADMVARADLHHLSYMVNIINQIPAYVYDDEEIAADYIDFLILLIQEYGRKADFMKEISAGRPMEEMDTDNITDQKEALVGLRLITSVLRAVNVVQPMVEATSSLSANYGNLHFLERILYGRDMVMNAKDPFYAETLRRLCRELDIPFNIDSAEDTVLDHVTRIAYEGDVESFSRIWKDLMRLRLCVNVVWQSDLNTVLLSYALNELTIDEYLQEFSKAVREYHNDEYSKLIIPLYSLRIRTLEEVRNASGYVQDMLSQGKPFAEYLPWACPQDCRTEGFEEYREAYMKLCKFIVRTLGYEMNEAMIAQANDYMAPLLNEFGASDVGELLYIIGNFALELQYEGYNDAYTIIEDLLRLADSGFYDAYQMANIAVVYTDISNVKVEHIIDDILAPSIAAVENWYGGAESQSRIDAMLLTSYAALNVNKDKYLPMVQAYVKEVENFLEDVPREEKGYYYGVLADVYSFMGQGDKARYAMKHYLGDVYKGHEDLVETGMFMSYYHEGRHRDAMKYVKNAVGTEGVVYPLYAMETAFRAADYKMAQKLADTYLHNRYLMTENMLMATPENKSDLSSLMRERDVLSLGAVLDSSYGQKACENLLAGLIYDWNLISKGALLRSMQSWHSYMMDKDDRLFGAYDLYNAFASEDSQEDMQMSGTYASVVSYELSDLIRVDYEWGKLVPRATYRDVMDRLDKGSYALEFSSIADEYYAVVVGKGYKAPELYHLCSRDDIMNVSADMFTEYLYEDEASLKKLYDLVWAPVLSGIPEGSDIYCSLDGVLNLLNVELFCDGASRYAGDVYDIHRVTTTASFGEPVRIGDLSDAVLYGNMNYCMNRTEITLDSDKYIYNGAEAMYRGAVMDFVVPRDYLRETRDEVNEVAAILGAHKVNTLIFEWNNGTEFSFKALSGKDFDVLHMATHGFWWGSDTDADGRYIPPMKRSGLVLSGSDQEPISSDKAGVLFAQEISEMDLSSVDLLVLSACQTAGGELQEDGVFGLQRGFKQAGVGTIVMTLWPVKSAMTQSLMTLMYENLSEGCDAREAFYKARAEIRKDYKKASDWGAFIILD